MRVRPAPISPLYPKIRFAFTDHPLTVWAGAILLRLYFEVIGLRTSLAPLLVPFAKTSNNQIPTVDVLLAWWYGRALGAERFAHMTRYRRDSLLPRLLGLPRFPSPDTLRRFFCGFTYRRTTEVSEALMRFSLRAMRPILLGHTLDLDSTVFCRYGEQDGRLKGHNPIKRGRPSHHPLVAWLSERRRLLWAPLRAWHGQPRRFVCLRQTLTDCPDASGRRLIECPGYTYRVFVTSVPFAAELVTRMYVGRADSENRIKELKEDLSLDTFCLQSFEATDAAFRTGCVLYNLLMGFRETVLPSGWFERRLRVRFAVPPAEWTELLQRLRTLSEGLPIAAQLDWDLSAAKNEAHAFARAPNPSMPTIQPSHQTAGASP